MVRSRDEKNLFIERRSAPGVITSGRAHWIADTSIELLETTIGQALVEVATRQPDIDALRWIENGCAKSLTYSSLLERANARANEILSGASPGECVAVWAPNCIEWVVLEYASALAGTVLVGMNPALVDREIAYALRSSGAVRLYAVKDSRGKPLLQRAGAVAESSSAVRAVVDLEADVTYGPGALPEVEPSDPFLIQFTSGTTGEPKGAVLTHRAAYNAARMFATLLTRPDERLVSCAPLPYHHVAGSVSRLIGSLAVAGTHVVLPSADLRHLATATTLCGVTHGGLLGKLAVDLLEDPQLLREFDGHNLRLVGMGGSGVPAELIRRVEDALGVKVFNGYGQSESPHITLTVPEDSDRDRWHTIGQPVPQRDVAIIRPDGSIAEIDETGEICTRGPLVMSGYLGDPEKTAAVMSEGWLHTGDFARMDERGYVTYAGRTRDMVIRGGENIYPAEVEARLTEHPEILEVVIVPVPDARWGEQVFAFVRLAEGSSLDQHSLREYARSVLAPFKVPAFWSLVEDFPRTAIGKVMRRDLVARAAADVAQDVCHLVLDASPET